MEILIALARELIGMFVDDGSLVVAILAVVALAALAALVFQAHSIAGVLLVLGCLAALGENVLRASRN